MEAIIGIGSNIGDRQGYIRRALELIGRDVGEITAVSPVIETEAYGYEDQDDFLNLAISVETELEPFDLLGRLNAIEAELDRVRTIRWGPRTIDLDIIFYGDEIIDEENLHIPHVDMYNRDFVLGPVAGIRPEKKDPRTGRTVRELLEELDDRA